MLKFHSVSDYSVHKKSSPPIPFVRADTHRELQLFQIIGFSTSRCFIEMDQTGLDLASSLQLVVPVEPNFAVVIVDTTVDDNTAAAAKQGVVAL